MFAGLSISMGLDANSNSCIEQLANKTTNGDCTELANKMNDFFLSVSEHLPRSHLIAIRCVPVHINCEYLGPILY